MPPILDNAGEVSVYYRYNAWGVCTVLDANGAQITDASHIGNLNPFRYRSYYYGMAGVHNTVFTKLLSRKFDLWLHILVENVFTAGFKLTNSFVKPYFVD